ncbi:MAG: FG-GAP-like repeat-containing protein, partial [Armatimonadota bacterium]
LYRLDPDGHQIWKTRTYGHQPRDYETGKVKEILVTPLQSDGPPVILAGADNWHLSAFTLDGEELWHCWYYSHSTTFITTGDIDGDGVKEIFQGTSFADTNWFDARGEESHFQRPRIGPAADGVTADLDADGKDEMIAVGQKGVAAMTVVAGEEPRAWDDRVEWRIDTGCPQTSVVVADVDGNGVDDIVTAGKNGFIWAVGEGGGVHWVRNAGNSINDLVIADLDRSGKSAILAASDDGSVQVWSLNGRLLRRINIGVQVVKTAVADIDGDGNQEIVAVTIDNILHAVRP